MYKSTDFTPEEYKGAFNQIIARSTLKNSNIIFERSVVVKKDSITKCMYCNSPLTKVYSARINLIKHFGKFCSELCELVYMNNYKNVLNVGYSKKNITFIPYCIIRDRVKFDSLKKLNIDRVNKIGLLKEETGCVKYNVYHKDNRVDSDTIAINEWSTKESPLTKCIYCDNDLLKKEEDEYVPFRGKFLRNDNNFIGPFCSYICKVTIANILRNTIVPEKRYSFQMPDYNLIPNEYIEIKSILEERNIKELLIGFDNLSVYDDSIKINIRVMKP